MKSYQYNILGTLDLIEQEQIQIRNYETGKNYVRKCYSYGTYRTVRIERTKREDREMGKRVEVCTVTSIETFVR
jgi:hypothetical protein